MILGAKFMNLGYFPSDEGGAPRRALRGCGSTRATIADRELANAI
jgi:hypothetical protein